MGASNKKLAQLGLVFERAFADSFNGMAAPAFSRRIILPRFAAFAEVRGIQVRRRTQQQTDAEAQGPAANRAEMCQIS
jgi:hypothetical protein